MNPVVITVIILVAITGALLALYFVGNKLQKKQMAQKEQVAQTAQQMSMLIIDKKMMKLKDANLPKVVLEQTPKRYRNAKVPIVKAKVGPQTVNLICDDVIFDDLPTKCEVKAMVSGIYITGLKSVRGKKHAAKQEPQKKSFGAKMRQKQRQLQKELAAEEKEKAAKKASKQEEKARKEKAKKITQ